MTKLNRHDQRVIISVAILIVLASLFRMLGKNDVLPLTLGYLRNLIYIGLFFAWACSIQKRIMQKSVRRYLTLIAALLLFWLVERTCKYFFLFEMPTETRYAWYLFYVPMTLVPLLGIFAAACMGEPEDYTPPKKMRMLILPAFAAIAAVLTNDLHQLVFAFPGGVLTDGGGKNAYAYGPLYFAVMVWIIFEVVAFLFVLLRKSRIPGKQKRILLPACFILLALVYGIVYITESPALRVFAGDATAVLCLIMAATFEACIYTGLIPSNGHYDELFDITTIGAQITDKQYRVALSSETAMSFPVDVLREAEEKPIISNNGLRLSGQPIRGGHSFWLEDVSDIANAIAELEDVNDTLEDSNDAKREENKSIKQRARLKELNRMYDKMQLETADQIHLLQERLSQFAAAKDTQEERRLLGDILVLGAYIKRRNNLLCILEKQKTTEALDLDYCLHESMEALQMQGVKIACAIHHSGDMDVKLIMRLYDAFETVVEGTLGTLSRLNVSVKKEEAEYVLLLEVHTTADISGLSRRGFICEDEDDGDWLLTFRTDGEEGEAS